MPWFTDLRKIALAACISAVFGNLLPLWNAIHIMLSLGATNLPWRLLRISVVVLTALTAITPVFYFALYKNAGPLRIPKRLRLLALSCAFVDGLMLATGLPKWALSLVPYGQSMKTLDEGIAHFVRDPKPMEQVSLALQMLAEIIYVFLLIAIFRQRSDRSETNAPVSRQLSLVTKVTVITLGFVMSVLLLGLLLTPYTFYKLRNYPFPLVGMIPTFGELFIGQLKALLQEACLFAAPYIVYRICLDHAETPH